MEALQLVKFSIRQGHALDFMAKCRWDAELEEPEQLITADALIPEDLDFYKFWPKPIEAEPKPSQAKLWQH